MITWRTPRISSGGLPSGFPSQSRGDLGLLVQHQERCRKDARLSGEDSSVWLARKRDTAQGSPKAEAADAWLGNARTRVWETFRGLEILIRWQRALQQHPEGCPASHAPTAGRRVARCHRPSRQASGTLNYPGRLISSHFLCRLLISFVLSFPTPPPRPLL